MLLIQFILFTAFLFLSLTMLRLIQAHSGNGAVGRALAFTLH